MPFRLSAFTSDKYPDVELLGHTITLLSILSLLEKPQYCFP